MVLIAKELITQHELIGLEGVDLKSIVLYYLIQRGVALEWAYEEVFVNRAEEIDSWNTK